MSPDEKRIAIAEACPALVEWHDGLPYWRGYWSAVGEGNEHHALFDPLTDLNAMHEAEGFLEMQQLDAYEANIAAIQSRQEVGVYARRLRISATAAQRADAFLLTKGYKL